MNLFKKIVSLLFILMIFSTNSVLAVPTPDEDGMGIRNPISNEDVYLEDETVLQNQMDNRISEETFLDLVTDTNGLENEEGALWEAHEDYFESIKSQQEEVYGEGAYDSTEEIIKEKYNPVQNTFDCGRFEVQCHFISIGITFMTSFIQVVLKPLSMVSVNPSVIMDRDISSAFIDAFSILTNSLLAVFLLFQIIKVTTLKIGNFEHVQPELTDKIIKTVIAVFLIGSYEDLFRIILNLQFVFVYPIINTFTNTESVSQSVVVKLFFFDGISVILIIFLVLSLLLLVIVIQFFYNIAFLTILYITGPLSITTMVNDEYNFFSIWLRNIVARVLTVFLQSICIVISLMTLLNIQDDLSENLFNIFMTFAFLVVGMSIPSLLQQFGNSSGSGKATVATIKSISRGVMK